MACAHLNKQSLGVLGRLHCYMNDPIIGLWLKKHSAEINTVDDNKNHDYQPPPTTTTTTFTWQWHHQRYPQISWESEIADAYIEMHDIPFEPCLE